MKTMHILTLALALFLALSLVAGLALAADGPERPRQVLAGGASESAAPGLSLRATLGQPIVGLVSNGDITLTQGFWHGAPYRIHLPLVMRGA